MECFGQPARGERRPFSRATKSGGMVWVSGHSASHASARGVCRGAIPGEEVRNAIPFLAGLRAEAGSGLDRGVQVSMLVSDRDDCGACNAEYVKHFAGGLPARRTALFGIRTEAGMGFACVALAACDCAGGTGITA